MDVAYASALSALGGSVIGGVTSAGMTWPTQIGHEFPRCEDLCRDCIVAASKTYGDALVSSEPKLPELIALYSMISRMRVTSAPRTVASADKVMLTIIDAYFSPSRSVRELRDQIKAGRHRSAEGLQRSRA
jgi:hypothetical protein